MGLGGKKKSCWFHSSAAVISWDEFSVAQSRYLFGQGVKRHDEVLGTKISKEFCGNKSSMTHWHCIRGTWYTSSSEPKPPAPVALAADRCLRLLMTRSTAHTPSVFESWPVTPRSRGVLSPEEVMAPPPLPRPQSTLATCLGSISGSSVAATGPRREASAAEVALGSSRVPKLQHRLAMSWTR